MIKLTDFFNKLPNEEIKIKFNMNAGNPDMRAWDLLLEDSPEWKNMNAYKSRQPSNNLGNARYLIAFAQYYPYGPNYYIFGGIYKIEKIIPELFNTVGYNLVLTDFYKDYIKRLIIKLKKPIGRDIYLRKYSNIDDNLEPEVYEVAPSTKLGNFMGYNNILLTHKEMQYIIKNEEPTWKNALSKVKGIYVITDTSNGELYIGSASGNDGIWQRWSSYANINNLTGGNKIFEDMKNNNKDRIINNFTYSILEIFDIKTNQEYILQRESYWKNVLKTKTFGMNCN